jgi:branched-chain amino acid transport system permease protein
MNSSGSRIWKLGTHPILLTFFLFAILPLVLPLIGGHISLATEVLIMSIFGLAFNLLLGYTGLTSFGHAAYLGLGAYGFALCQLHLTKQVWLVPILSGILLTGIIAFLVGCMISRKRGIYYSLLTLAIGQLFYFVAFRWNEVTGGETGLTGLVRPTLQVPGLFSLDLSNAIHFYYFVLTTLLITIVVLLRIVNSPFGAVLQLIKQNETRARYLGYDTFWYKCACFTISGLFSGLAGVLYAMFTYCAFADYLYWVNSGDVVMMTLIGGGLSSFFGPLAGSAIFIIARNLFSSYTQHWQIFMGAIFVIFILAFPEGLFGILQKHRLFRPKGNTG